MLSEQKKPIQFFKKKYFFLKKNARIEFLTFGQSLKVIYREDVVKSFMHDLQL